MKFIPFRLLKRKLTPAESLITGYIVFVIIGTILLLLPFSETEPGTLSIVNAIFTSTSAITGTGLVVVDTGSFFTFAGNIVILTLIQIGNLGYMMFFALAAIIFGRRLSIMNRMIIRESISYTKLDIKKFVIKIFKYSFIIEGISAVLFILYWKIFYDLDDAVFSGIYHSISSFCTAGFSLYSDSFVKYQNDYFLNFLVLITSYLGCIGFFVLYDLSEFSKSILSRKREKYSLSTHSKIVLTFSLSIILIGSVSVFLIEKYVYTNPEAMGYMGSLFQVTSATATVGFNTFNLDQFSNSSSFIVTLIMYIGASPSGTGGGIKTTVFAIMILSFWAYSRDKKRVNIFKREIHPGIIARAFSISLFVLIILFFSLLMLTLLESANLVDVIFEAASAMSGTGLSRGITASLHPVSKMVLCVLMLTGRIGPLIIGYIVLGGRKELSYELPKADVIIV
jgi:trk system potassium uptake protein TrkH